MEHTTFNRQIIIHKWGFSIDYVSLPKVYLHIIVLFVCLHAKCAYKDIMYSIYYRCVYIYIVQKCKKYHKIIIYYLIHSKNTTAYSCFAHIHGALGAFSYFNSCWAAWSNPMEFRCPPLAARPGSAGRWKMLE